MTLVRHLPIVVSWPIVCRSLGIVGVQIRKVRHTPLGLQLLLQLTAPTTVRTLEDAAEEIGVAYSVARVRVARHFARGDRAVLNLDVQTDLGRIPFPMEFNPIGLPLDVLRPFALGLDDEGSPFLHRFSPRHTLIGGSPGSGKSNALRVFLAYLAASRNVRLVGIDPKRVELALWRERFHSLVLGHDEEATLALLDDLLEEIERRTNFLEGGTSATLQINAEFPLIVLIIDEWAELAALGDAKTRAFITNILRRYVSLGRAVQCTAILCTQRPTSEVIDVGTRTLLHDRFALKCGDRFQAEAILGHGSYNAGSLEGASPGRALWSDGRPCVPFQFFEISDSTVKDLVCAGLRI